MRKAGTSALLACTASSDRSVRLWDIGSERMQAAQVAQPETQNPKP
jgi:hypothetical protein